MTTVIGIDLGTTSVKINLTRFEDPNDHLNGQVLQRVSLAYHDHVRSLTFQQLNRDNIDNLMKTGEINPYLVISTLLSCIKQLDKKFRQEVGGIGITGQMHGVCYWNRQAIDRIVDSRVDSSLNLIFDRDYESLVSNLITWEDNRCDKDFLDQLPNNSENRKCHTGYGVATTFWLQKNNATFLSRYSYMGSIMDFLIHLLCPTLKRPVTSNQLANSYGYFDTNTNDWSDDLNDHNFPRHLLPNVLSDYELAGRLGYELLAIKERVAIFVACGDLQCAVYCAMKNKSHSAILNSGTSMQLAFPISRNEWKEQKTKFNKLTHLLNEQMNQLSNNLSIESADPLLIEHLDVVPYFNNDFLVTCSSLNGGNVIAFFVNSIRKIVTDLVGDQIVINDTELWSRIAELAQNYVKNKNSNDNELNIEPRLFGERNEKVKSKFSINSITSSNLELGQLYYTLCMSLIENIFIMCPVELLKALDIDKICLVGSTVHKNAILKECLQNKLNTNQLDIIYEEKAEADLGISSATMRNLNRLLKRTE